MVPGALLSSRLSLCGPGRAGKAFARSWIAAGGVLHEVLARDLRAAELAVATLASGRPRASGGPISACDILVVAVPDDAIAEVAAALAPRAACRLAFHLSGALPAKALAPLAGSAPGAALGSLHPLRAFTGAEGETWRGAFVAVEGDPPAVEAGLAMAAALQANGNRLDAEGKTLYHAGAQLAAGGTAAVISLAARAWVEAGLDPERAREALAGLSASAAGAAFARPFAEAFSGAVARRDVGTVRAHVEALALAQKRDILEVYRRLAEETLARTPGRGREDEMRALLARCGPA
ncbi:MAG TPA: DUF2520 domain-containing protein [Thermoanaerobaculia bacterium]|nr:DUF2520 domain-containing protein [Thermoanaerobaculia bacterium]